MTDMVVLEGFDVIALEGKGVWIVDDEDNAWRVGGHVDDTESDNRLEREYAKRFGES